MNHYLALAWRCHPKLVWTIIDAPPSSLMDSISNPKVMTRKGEGVGARSLVHNTLGVEGCVGAPRWGLGISTSKSITHTYLHKPNNKLLVHSWNTFGAWTNHEQTRIHKNHHGPNLGGSHHLPLYNIFCCLATGPTPKCHFVLRLFHTLPFLHTLPHSWEHEMWFPGFIFGPPPSQALILVASPRLGLRQ